MGKTVLARAAVARLAAANARQTMEVDLIRVDDDQALAGAVADQMGFDSFEAVLAAPIDRSSAVVLDNCEHLLDAVSSVVVRLLGAHDQLTHGIRQLGKAHPRFGHHLTHAIRTGTWFAYEPEQPVTWDVDRHLTT